MVVFALGKNLLFKSGLGHCELRSSFIKGKNIKIIKMGPIVIVLNSKDKEIMTMRRLDNFLYITLFNIKA